MLSAQHLAVEGPHDQAVVLVGGHCPDDVVLVGELVVAETAVEEAVDALIGGHPEAVPAVDEDVADEVDAGEELSHLLMVAEVDAVLVGHDKAAAMQSSDGQSVAGSAPVGGCEQREAVASHAVDAVGGEGQEGGVRGQQGVDIAPGRQPYGFPFPLGDAEDACLQGDDHFARCRVEAELAVGCHLVQQAVCQHRRQSVLRHPAQAAVLLQAVFHQHIAVGQAAGIEVVEQPVALRVEGHGLHAVVVHAPLPEESQCPDL